MKTTEPKTKATMKLQLGRSYSQYELGSRTAKWRKRLGFSTCCSPPEYLIGLCSRAFKGMSGLSLKKGEVRNVTITIRLEAP